MKLPEGMRELLKKPLGKVATDLRSLKKESLLITVGDESTKAVLAAGFTPKVVVYDGKTSRKPVNVPAEVEAYGDRSVRVANPAGTLQEEVFEVFRTALEGGGSTRVFVDGEEDLTALAAIMEAPVGSTVVYGQPGSGLVVVSINKTIKDKVSKIIGEMEDGDYGS